MCARLAVTFAMYRKNCSIYFMEVSFGKHFLYAICVYCLNAIRIGKLGSSSCSFVVAKNDIKFFENFPLSH